MSNQFKAGWYIVYVKSRYEKKVSEVCARQLIESYLPLVKRTRNWSDRKKTIYTPLFSSYVFVRMTNQSDYSKILSIDGVCGFIRAGKEFARMKDTEINNIRKLLQGDFENVETTDIMPGVGEHRSIQSGFLNGVECEVLQVDNQNKILVRIDSIQMQITATVSAKYLDKQQQYQRNRHATLDQ